MAVKIDKKNCSGCGRCIDVCPVSAIRIEKEKAIVDDTCIICGTCVGECPTGAISFPK